MFRFRCRVCFAAHTRATGRGSFAQARRLGRLLARLGLSACLLVPPATAAARPAAGEGEGAVARGAAGGAAEGTGVRIDRGRITVEIGQVPVAEVLAAVARDLRADVLVRGDLGLTKAQTFSEAPLLDGLERLVQPNHLVVEFAPRRDGVSPRIVRIRVFGLGAATDPSAEPESLTAAGGSAAVARTARTAAGFDGNLGWSYDDASQLPPVAQRVRRIGGIYAVSGVAGLDALRTVIDNDPNSAPRAAAVRSVAAFPYQDAVPLLQQALYDESIEVRLAAVSAINPDPTEPPMFLVDTIVNEEEDPRVRLTALERLGRFRLDEQVQDALTDIAASDDPRISQAAQALVGR